MSFQQAFFDELAKIASRGRRPKDRFWDPNADHSTPLRGHWPKYSNDPNADHSALLKRIKAQNDFGYAKHPSGHIHLRDRVSGRDMLVNRKQAEAVLGPL